MNEIELKLLITKQQIKKNVMANAKYIREQLGYSATGMGQRLGLSRQSYESIESGKSIAVDNLINMARLCNISMENLLLNDLSNRGK